MAARTLGKNIQNTSVIRKYNDTDLLNHFHFACVLTKTGNTLWPFLYATPICMPSITGEVLLQGGKHVPRVCSHICNVLGKITVLLTHCIPVVRIPQCLAFRTGLSILWDLPASSVAAVRFSGSYFDLSTQNSLLNRQTYYQCVWGEVCLPLWWRAPHFCYSMWDIGTWVRAWVCNKGQRKCDTLP